MKSPAEAGLLTKREADQRGAGVMKRHPSGHEVTLGKYAFEDSQ
jgi:hypothetical protein